LKPSLQDYAGFCRQVALSCFHRRCNYPLGSDERARLMHDLSAEALAKAEARRFLLWHRAATGRLDRRRTIPKHKLTAADITCPPKPRRRGSR
jgi:hypothetical protein